MQRTLGLVVLAACSPRPRPSTSAPPEHTAPAPADAGAAVVDPRRGHQTLEHLFALDSTRPAFESDFTIIGLDEEEAAVVSHARIRHVTNRRGDDVLAYELALPGITDGHPIALAPSTRSDQVVDGFTLTLPATELAPDAVMAALRKKYGRPDHHSHNHGFGVIWSRVRYTEAVMSLAGVQITVSEPANVYEPLAKLEQDDTTNAECNRFVATFDAYLACAAIPLDERLASGDAFDKAFHLWYPLRCNPPGSDGLDHSHDCDGFVPAKADVETATRECPKARMPFAAALAKAGCRDD